MSFINDTWRQLVHRRLWPVALLLVVALAAVPVVLAKDPAPPAPLAPVKEPPLTTATADPIVALASAEDRSKRRRVLGARKDPFRPAPVPKGAKTAAGSPGTGAPGGYGGPSPGLPGGGGPDSGSGPDAFGPSGGVPDGGSGPIRSPEPDFGPGSDGAPSPETGSGSGEGEERRVRPERGSITVRFGDAKGEQLDTLTLNRLAPLPSEEDPVLVFLGLTPDGKRARFLLDDRVVADGDGVCKPHPTNCETIELGAGETQFVDVRDDGGQVAAQYQLDVVKLRGQATRASAPTSGSSAPTTGSSAPTAADSPAPVAAEPTP